MANSNKFAVMSVHPRLKSSDRRGEAYCVNVEYNKFDPNRKTVVLLHGYMGSIDDYDPAFVKLDDRYNLIAIDLRGHGDSEAPNGKDIGWEMIDHAEDIAQVIRMIIPGVRFSIMASSMSTAIALEIARLYPEYVKNLFLLSPTSKFSIPVWLKLLVNIGKISPSKLVESAVDTIATIVSKFGSEEEKELWEVGYVKFQKISLEIHKKIFTETLSKWEIEPDSVIQPVFIIAGLRDSIIPHEDTLELLDALPNASLLTFSEAEHQLIIKKKEEVFDLLIQWLEDPISLMKTRYYSDEDVICKNGKYQLSLPIIEQLNQKAKVTD